MTRIDRSPLETCALLCERPHQAPELFDTPCLPRRCICGGSGEKHSHTTSLCACAVALAFFCCTPPTRTTTTHPASTYSVLYTKPYGAPYRTPYNTPYRFCCTPCVCIMHTTSSPILATYRVTSEPFAWVCGGLKATSPSCNRLYWGSASNCGCAASSAGCGGHPPPD